MMALSRKKIKKEIENVEKSIKSLEETLIKCQDGIEINTIVLEAFQKELECTSI